MAVHTSQSVVKAAGGNTARGRSRGTGTPPPTPGRLRRALSVHWYAWAMVAPVVLVIGVIIGYPLVRGMSSR
ncbi:ABC transporter permease [Streptomyces badius]